MKKSNKMILLSIIILSGVAMWMFAKQNSKLGLDSDHTPTFFLNIITHKKVIGNGKRVSKVISPSPFNAFNVVGDFDVLYSQDTHNSMTLTADANVLPYINSTISNSQVFVNTPHGALISQGYKPTISLSAPEINAMRVMGTTTLHATNLNSDSLLIFLGGNSTADIQGDIKKSNVTVEGISQLNLKLVNEDTVAVTIDGNGTAYLSGVSKNIDITIKGNGSVNASNLKADNVTITSQGNTNVAVHAVKILTINSMGNGNIQYLGAPQITKMSFGQLAISKINNPLKENLPHQ